MKWRRALVIHDSAGGDTVPVITRLAATAQDRMREMFHWFNEVGLRSLGPQWAGSPWLAEEHAVSLVTDTTRHNDLVGRI